MRSPKWNSSSSGIIALSHTCANPPSLWTAGRMKYESPNRYVRIVDRSVQRTMQVRDTQRTRAGGEPASQDRFRGLLRRVQRNETKRRRMTVSTRAIERPAVLDRGR